MPDKYLGTNIADRRRTRRRRLQGPASVTVRSDGEGANRSFEAALLNLSEEGLACRMDTAEAKRLSIGQTLTVSYSLPAASAPFVCPSRVANITPCGGPDRSIVGMEFVFCEEAVDERRRLRVALERIMDAPEASFGL